MTIRRTAKAEAGARSPRAGGFASWAAALGLLVGRVNTVLLLALVAGRGDEHGAADGAGRLAEPPRTDGAPAARPAAEPAARPAETPPAEPAAADAAADRADEPPADARPATVGEPPAPAPPEPAPPEARVGLRLQVLNGAGEPRLAARTGDALLRQRYDVRETGNARETAARSRILVRRGGLPLGLRLAEDLGLAPDRVLLEPDARLVDVDLTLVVGADWRSLRPFR